MGVQTPIELGHITRQACSVKINNLPCKIGKTTLKNMRCGLLTPGDTSYELQLDIYALPVHFGKKYGLMIPLYQNSHQMVTFWE